MGSSLWQWTVEEDLSGIRADKALLQAIEEGRGQWEGEPVSWSRSRIQRLIEEGRITVNDVPVEGNTRLKPGTHVRVAIPPPKPAEVLPEEMPVELVFQDPHIVVINKPPGLTVHPSPTQMEGTLVNALLHLVNSGVISDLSGVGGVLRPGIVHRIDKGTSGLLVVSKTDEAHRKLVEIFSKHEIERCYWALCYGAPARSELRIDSTIGRNPKDRKKMAMNLKGGRKAVTHARTLERFGHTTSSPFASLIGVTLETGRTHQIRVHLTGSGHSILGDPVYGNPTENQPKWKALPADVQESVLALPGQALHAKTLGFAHPITGQRMRFESDPPPDFSRLLGILRRYSLV